MEDEHGDEAGHCDRDAGDAQQQPPRPAHGEPHTEKKRRRQVGRECDHPDWLRIGAPNVRDIGRGRPHARAGTFPNFEAPVTRWTGRGGDADIAPECLSGKSLPAL